MDHLPDPSVINKIIAKQNAVEAKEQQLFSARVDLEDVAQCLCTLCPPRDQLEQYDYCCKQLFVHPLKKNGQMLRDGLKGKMNEEESSCICLHPLFKESLLSDVATNAAVALYSYQRGIVDQDKNREKRFACYRVIVATLMGPLGRGVRIRLPACVISEVRKKWPSPSYTGFRPSDILDD